MERAFKEAFRLPEVGQSALAKRGIEELEAEGRWKRAFTRSEDIIDRLADEALSAHENGKTKPPSIEAL